MEDRAEDRGRGARASRPGSEGASAPGRRAGRSTSSRRAGPPSPARESLRCAWRPSVPPATAVNELWRIRDARRGGFRGWLLSLVSRCFSSEFETQERFNSAQVRLDNELVEWIEARFAATHRHYDTVLGQMGHHLGEIDTRHLMLQAEVVKHTHDLVRRIDLVLAESEKSRMVLDPDAEGRTRPSCGPRRTASGLNEDGSRVRRTGAFRRRRS